MVWLAMNKYNVHVTGKNICLGNFFQNYNLAKLEYVFSKYAANIISSQTILEKRDIFFKVKLSIILDNKKKFETLGRGKKATLALDLAVNNIAKRIRRHYRKLKNHRFQEKRFNTVKKDLMKFHLSF